jgi:hypothetical protein
MMLGNTFHGTRLLFPPFAGYHDVCFTNLFLPFEHCPSRLRHFSPPSIGKQSKGTGSPFLLDRSLATGYTVKPVSRGWGATYR